ncbi:hypothetical protein SAMN06295885_1090 [Rathayibacter oskolensis]|uniref:Uncharacterized protein n=1 Tax=Rathayibacter oskolensis TaxID=1891671 RepID=A0A1X7NC22_9MICO|nr:hypothetical protein [Rathayibacter oskolensis]SMH35173.1 hypothetical protein SAMN06295885_1090 [Rathayibacter oskolensis]
MSDREQTPNEKPLDPLSDFSLPGDADLHVEGDASGADGAEVEEPGDED